MSSQKKYAILVAGHIPEETKERFGDYGAMFKKLLRHTDSEIWDSYTACDGEIPSDEEMMTYDAIVVTGSKHDSFENYPWLVKLRQTLQAAYQRGQKILAFCFGHQVMAIVLGGKSGRATWELGCVQVSANKALNECWFMKDFDVPIEKFWITQFHQDQVLEAPPQATILASSAQTPYEMYSMGDNVLCMQGHPEFEVEFSQQLLNLKRGNPFPEDLVVSALDTLKSNPPDIMFLRKLCQNFLHGLKVRN